MFTSPWTLRYGWRERLSRRTAARLEPFSFCRFRALPSHTHSLSLSRSPSLSHTHNLSLSHTLSLCSHSGSQRDFVSNPSVNHHADPAVDNSAGTQRFCSSLKALLRETKVESGTSQSKDATSVDLGNSGYPDRFPIDILTRVYEPEIRTRLGRNRELCTLLRT